MPQPEGTGRGAGKHPQQLCLEVPDMEVMIVKTYVAHQSSGLGHITGSFSLWSCGAGSPGKKLRGF